MNFIPECMPFGRFWLNAPCSFWIKHLILLKNFFLIFMKGQFHMEYGHADSGQSTQPKPMNSQFYGCRSLKEIHKYENVNQ
jgi:hypothetical protein